MKVLVAGDIMIDRYLYGAVERLSQEAPVPVVRMQREECRAGAAANVAMNCASLGAIPTLVGILASDKNGRDLIDILNKHDICLRLTGDKTIRTTQKLRIIGRNQQIARIDTEDKPCSDAVKNMTAIAIEELNDHDIIVLSDYGKGALADVQTIIREAKKLGKFVLVDPKGHDYSKYAGADLVKPNIDEMKAMVGGWSDEAELRAKADKLRQSAGIANVLLTRAGEGMTLYGDFGMAHIPAKAREVYDVTGAGDTVMAAIAVQLSQGHELLDAAQYANLAAGIVVGKFGTATVSVEEMKGEMNVIA